MEDPNEEQWRIKEFRPPDKRTRQIWKCGVDLGKKMAVAGILVSALPPLAAISALALAFSLPSAFYIASCAATHTIMAALFPAPTITNPPLRLLPHYQDVCYCCVEEEMAPDSTHLEEYATIRSFESMKDDGSNISEDHEISVENEEPILRIPSPSDTTKGVREAEEGAHTIEIEAVLVSAELELERMEEVVEVNSVEPTAFGTKINGLIDNEHSTEKDEAVVSISSEILKGITEAEEEEDMSMSMSMSMDLLKNQSEKDGLGNDVEAVAVSADAVVEGVDVFSPPELERETTGMMESTRDESVSETNNPRFLKDPCTNVKGSDDIDLEGSYREMEKSTANDLEAPPSIPNESNQDIEAAIGSGSNPHLSGEKTPTLSQHVRARKLVVHVSNSGDSKGRSVSRGRGDSLILRAAISTGISSCGMQDAYLDDATSKPIEGMYNEARIWKQINALRTIVGYKAPPHSSCSEELKALYVFTGVEPPTSFNELADVHEKLMLLMAVVGVKE